MRYQHSKDVPAFKQWTSKDWETVKEGKKGQRNGRDQRQGQAPAMSKTDNNCFCRTERESTEEVFSYSPVGPPVPALPWARSAVPSAAGVCGDYRLQASWGHNHYQTQFRNMAPVGAQPSSQPPAVLGVRDRETPTLIRPWSPMDVGRKTGSGQPVDGATGPGVTAHRSRPLGRILTHGNGARGNPGRMVQRSGTGNRVARTER